MPVRKQSKNTLTHLQERFIREGLQELEDREIVELLLSLCPALSVRKARQMTKSCVDRFQNLSNFLTAPAEELQQLGISPACILCIKLLYELPAQVLKQSFLRQSVYKYSKEVFDYLYYSMRDLKIEVFKVIYLDNQSQIIDTADLFEGTQDGIPIRPREIIESAISRGAAGLIFVHNHPSGDPTPTRSDKQLTRDLVFVGNILQIKALDHIIIGQDQYFSFADEGLIQKYEDNFLNINIRSMPADRSLCSN